MGETHLSIATEKLARKFGVEVETDDVHVAYRETISGTAEAEGRLKKQSGGHGQFAVAWLRVEPNERGAGNEFVDAIVGGVIPRNFIPAVEKGVIDTEEHGGALGFPVVDVKVTCFDGKHHPVDSSEMAFKTAAAIGLHRRARQGRPGPARTGERARRRRSPKRARATSWATSTRKRGRIQGIGVARRRRGRGRRARCRRPRCCGTRSTCAR